MPSNVPSGPNETDGERLRGILAPDALSVALVSAFAGDRVLTAAERATLTDLQAGRGELFFSDLLYTITHQYFQPTAAAKLWDEILKHKYEISKTLKRNVQIIVATLDYLTNLKTGVRLPTLVNEAYIAEIVNMSMRDGLTGLFNHTSFFEIIGLELKRCARHGAVVALILVDIDDFKLINDNCGHQEGDRILKDLAAAIDTATRDADICCRYGGEEFAVILPLTDVREAADIAERIRTDATRIQAGDCTLTISLGVTAYSAQTPTVHALVEQADRALYRAKRSGKNRVVIFEERGNASASTGDVA